MKNTESLLRWTMNNTLKRKRKSPCRLAQKRPRRNKYPEFSYPGQIVVLNTSIARAGLDYDTAGANYTGNFLYRSAGLYGIGTRLFRRL